MFLPSTDPRDNKAYLIDFYLLKEVWIGFEKWMIDIFDLQTNLDKISILFWKYDNRYIQRLKYLIISFTNSYILHSKTKTSRLNVNISKKSLTKRLFASEKNCNYHHASTFKTSITIGVLSFMLLTLIVALYLYIFKLKM